MKEYLPIWSVIFYPYVCPSPSFLSVSSISSKEILSIYLHYIFSSAYFFIIFFFSWLSGYSDMADEVIVNLWTYNILSGLLISPFVIAIFFVKSFAVIPLLKIVIFGAILLMIVKIIRWIEILITHRVSILYMILYLCGLEILPILVLYKLLG